MVGKDAISSQATNKPYILRVPSFLSCAQFPGLKHLLACLFKILVGSYQHGICISGEKKKFWFQLNKTLYVKQFLLMSWLSLFFLFVFERWGGGGWRSSINCMNNCLGHQLCLSLLSNLSFIFQHCSDLLSPIVSSTQILEMTVSVSSFYY